MLIVLASNLKSCICVAAATTELTLLYPSDVELTASAIRLWNTICEANLLARIVWALRVRIPSDGDQRSEVMAITIPN